jgi:alpha-galactosidase
MILSALMVAAVALSAFADGPILTPPPPDTPRINGPRVYGQRPGRPFLYSIPATGDEPITFTATGLPPGLTLDPRLGRITGAATTEGTFSAMLTATNARGSDRKPLVIKIGDQIALTPPMGWNSWNCFAGAVDQEKVAAAARAMAHTGLIKHGWTYINIDDTWQGERNETHDRALQPNPQKFPDMKKLCDEIHALGLKAGIYSTPWVTSYANRPGGSAENPQGTWTKPTIPKRDNVNRKILPWAIGKYHFTQVDARQWADWGFDYLKYDWNPIEPPETQEMLDALKASGRDVVYSLSNHAPFAGATDWARLANAWRTTGDIKDNWKNVSSIGFSQDKWAEFAGPGHWNDADMLVVGKVGWGPHLHSTNLTPDEQYTHITLWCLLSSPLLIGCDMTQMDEFTLSLLTNDEVLAVDQDALGKEAPQVAQSGDTQVWARPLADGTWAVGLFNLGEQAGEVTVNFAGLKLTGTQSVRDLWRQKDLGGWDESFKAMVAPHGAVMVKVGRPH